MSDETMSSLHGGLVTFLIERCRTVILDCYHAVQIRRGVPSGETRRSRENPTTEHICRGFIDGTVDDGIERPHEDPGSPRRAGSLHHSTGPYLPGLTIPAGRSRRPGLVPGCRHVRRNH